MKLRILALLTLVFVLFACTAPPKFGSFLNNPYVKNFGVSLKIAGNKLKAKSKAQGWNRNGKKDGYVGYGPGEFGWVFLAMKDEDLGNTCESAGLGGDADWVITSVYLSAFPDPPATDEKGTKFGDPQPAWLQKAFPDVDLSDGHLFKTANKDEGITFYPIENANDQRGYKFAYYQVTVEECDGSGIHVLDPGIGNGGKQ